MIACVLVAGALWAQDATVSRGNSLIQQGRALKAKGDLDAAEPVYQELSEMTDTWQFEVAGVTGLFDIYQARGKFEEGIKVFRDHYLASHNLATLMLGVARLEYNGFPKRAEDEMVPVVEALDKGTIPADAALYLAETELRLGHHDIALRAAQRSHILYRGKGPVWFTTGLIINGILSDMGRTTEALDQLESLLDVDPNERRVLIRYAFQLAVHNKDLARARQMAEEAVSMPDLPGVYTGSADEALGLVLFKQGEIDGAVKALANALRKHPALTSARNYLAQALRRKRNPSAQTEDLLDALRNEPSAENNRLVVHLLQSF